MSNFDDNSLIHGGDRTPYTCVARMADYWIHCVKTSGDQTGVETLMRKVLQGQAASALLHSPWFIALRMVVESCGIEKKTANEILKDVIKIAHVELSEEIKLNAVQFGKILNEQKRNLFNYFDLHFYDTVSPKKYTLRAKVIEVAPIDNLDQSGVVGFKRAPPQQPHELEMSGAQGIDTQVRGYGDSPTKSTREDSIPHSNPCTGEQCPEICIPHEGGPIATPSSPSITENVLNSSVSDEMGMPLGSNSKPQTPARVARIDEHHAQDIGAIDAPDIGSPSHNADFNDVPRSDVSDEFNDLLSNPDRAGNLSRSHGSVTFQPAQTSISKECYDAI